MSADEEDTNEYLADRLNVAWAALRHVALTDLPTSLQDDVHSMGELLDDVLEAAARLRATS